MAGKVVNRAGLELPRRRYDKVVVGGGFLGLACTFYLRRYLRHETLLVIEADGVPSEAGGTYVSPGLAHRAFVDENLRRRAAWATTVLDDLESETGVKRPSFRRVGWARLGAKEKVAGLETLDITAWLDKLSEAERHNLASLVDLEGVSYVLYDPRGGYGSAEGAALSFGHASVGMGADLLINGRASLMGEGEVRIDRLEFNRMMQREVARQESVTAGTVIVAASAGSAALVAEGLGITLPLGGSYMQYPRLEASPQLVLEDGRVALPVVEYQGATLRPQGKGMLVVPPPLTPDLEAYEPTGGRLAGVRVGLRLELVEYLMDRLDSFPFLGWETLNLGKTVNAVRGAWEVHTPSGLPEWLEVTSSLYTILGGNHGFTLGLAAACDLAVHLSGGKERPWEAM